MYDLLKKNCRDKKVNIHMDHQLCTKIWFIYETNKSHYK
jgi:hypothetical protein